MGNSYDCCSDGVLVPNMNTFQTAGTMTGNSMMASFGPGASGYTPVNMPTPALPPIRPPSTVMDAMSARALQSAVDDDGPFQKDGEFLQNAPTVSDGGMTLPGFVSEVGRERGRPYPPFKFHRTRHTYIGEWKNHKFHGNGTLVFENGDFLTGSFANGSPLGRCRLVLISQGSFYEGHMRNWYADGEGVFRTVNGEYTYRGTFHNSSADGNGIEETPQSRFVGIFSQANKVKGVLTMRNGYMFDGDFQRNMFHGMGKLRSPNGQYIGQFQNGKKWGHGMFKWNDGSFYEGDYSNDMKHGKGRYVSADRQLIQEGQWRGGNFIGGVGGGVGGAPIPPLNAAAGLTAGLSNIMSGGGGNSLLLPGGASSNVRPYSPGSGIQTGFSPMQAPTVVETTTTTIETANPGYINPTAYVAPTNANNMPPAAMSAYTPGGMSTYAPGGMSAYTPPIGMTPASVYNPGTLTPASNYIPPGMSQYNPGIMTPGSNMSFRQ